MFKPLVPCSLRFSTCLLALKILQLGRKAYCSAARGKPSLVIGPDFAIYAGNESEQEMSLAGVELCGFNTGAYEQKAVAGFCFKK